MGFCRLRPSSANVADKNAAPGDIKKAKSAGIAGARITAAGSRFMLLQRTMRAAATHRRINLSMFADRIVSLSQTQAGGLS